MKVQPIIDPQAPLSESERQVFGANAERDAGTGIPYEVGSGAFPREVQAKLYAEATKEANDLRPILLPRANEDEA